jgi:hypothetical protein
MNSECITVDNRVDNKHCTSMDWQVGMGTLRTVRGAKYVLCQRGKAIGRMWDRPWYSSYLRCKGVRHQLLSGYFTSSQFRQLEFTLYPSLYHRRGDAAARTARAPCTTPCITAIMTCYTLRSKRSESHPTQPLYHTSSSKVVVTNRLP